MARSSLLLLLLLAATSLLALSERIAPPSLKRAERAAGATRGKRSSSSSALSRPKRAGLNSTGSKYFYNSVALFVRFNCAFPFCPTTALDVCTADEHCE
jgi:hypothetical protein